MYQYLKKIVYFIFVYGERSLNKTGLTMTFNQTNIKKFYFCQPIRFLWWQNAGLRLFVWHKCCSRTNKKMLIQEHVLLGSARSDTWRGEVTSPAIKMSTVIKLSGLHVKSFSLGWLPRRNEALKAWQIYSLRCS